MGGDNLAITLCSHFDDGEEHDNEHGWSNAAHDGYMEVIEAIRKHYEPAAARIEALEAGLKPFVDPTLVEGSFSEGFYEGYDGTWVEGDYTPAWKRSCTKAAMDLVVKESDKVSQVLE